MFKMAIKENGSPSLNRIRERFNNKPLLYRFYIKARVQISFFIADLIHYFKTQETK